MANFRVGQRVRIIGRYPMSAAPIGSAATIIGKSMPQPFFHYDWKVRADADGDAWVFPESQIAPLTDPFADAFVESIKRLKPYEEPKVVKESIHG